MITIALVLLVAALIVFILAAFNVPFPPRVNPLGLGLALWVLSLLIDKIKF